VLVFLARAFGLFMLGGNHEFGEVAIADVLGGALGEEVNVVLVVLELLFLLEVGLGAFLLLVLLLDAQLVEIAGSPLVGADVFGVLFDPGHGFLLRHLHLLRLVAYLHYISPLL
jgi:hypothetical protein